MRWNRARGAITAALLASVILVSSGVRADDPAQLTVTAVESVGFTVADMDRALAFYTGVLQFTKISETEASGREYELLTGVFGARARIARLQLGSETIELTEFIAPKGRPFPDDVRSNDRIFQHIAIVVSDMDTAYRSVGGAKSRHASTSPQRLPGWNPNAGGIEAFYFRDPDGHFLELIEFPPGKGDGKPQRAGTLFAGIDHTAIVVGDTDAALRFYRDTLGLAIAGESENHGIEQEHLNNVFGARLRITTLRGPAGPGIELLEYLAPRGGRPAPPDLQSNDVAHWQTSLRANDLDPLLPLARRHRVALVSPGPIGALPPSLGISRGALIRDPDGHAVRLVQR